MYKHLLEAAELITPVKVVEKESPICQVSCECEDTYDEDYDFEDEDLECHGDCGDPFCSCEDDIDDDEGGLIPDTSSSKWKNHISTHRYSPKSSDRGAVEETSQLDILKARYASFDPNN